MRSPLKEKPVKYSVAILCSLGLAALISCSDNGNGTAACPAGSCNLACATGSCLQDCSSGTDCDADCAGGGCNQECAGDASCDFGCAGGGCTQTCEPGSDCDLTCNGGGCTQACQAGSTCTTTCAGDGCTTTDNSGPDGGVGDDGGLGSACVALCGHTSTATPLQGTCVNDEADDRGYNTNTISCNILWVNFASGSATAQMCSACYLSMGVNETDCAQTEAICFP